MTHNNNGRLSLPGQLNTDITLHPGPMAMPQSFTLNNLQAGQVKMDVYGGLTKLETAAIHAMASLLQDGGGWPTDRMAQNAVDAAELVLKECERRQQAAE